MPPLSPVSLKRQLFADGALILVALIWGSTFVLVKDSIAQVPTFLFLALRFTFAAVALALVILLLGRWRAFTWREIGWGAALGVALYAGYALQTAGLEETTATNAGFLTGLSIVLVPLLGIPILRQKPGIWAWIGVLLALIGPFLLSVGDNMVLSINRGDPLVLGCALAFALHIVLVSRVAGRFDPLRLTLVQVLVTSVLSVFSSALFEPRVAGVSLEIWASAAFLGIVASALAIGIQVSVQQFTSAVHAVLIFALEPVFAAIFGILLQGDRLGPLAWVGAGFILSGMLVAELGTQLTARVRRRQSQTKLQLPEAG